jgi:hypothetical protein
LTTYIKNSRMIPFSDVPEVNGFTGKFVYNFFVPDETMSKTGSKRFQGALDVITSNGQKSVVDTYGHQVDISAINSEVARFVELDWNPAGLMGVDSFFDAELGEPGFLEKHKGVFNDEGSMNSPIDAQMRTRDSNLRSRLNKKLRMLGHIAKSGDDSTSTVASLTDLFENVDDIDSKIVENILSKLSFADTGYVNERKVVDRTAQFLPAEDFNLYSNVDRRIGEMIFNPIFNQNVPGISKYETFWKDNNKNYALLKNESQKLHFELGLKVLPGKTKLPAGSEHSYEAVPIGYIIERTEPSVNSGLFSSDPTTYYIDGAASTKFFDSRVVYNQTYRYKISAVYAVKIVTAIADNPQTKAHDAGFYRMTALVKSKQSKSVIIKTEELVPPAEPDGVLYRYNYDEGTGLLINWQMPAGKQRDIKYFQVFRRKSIYEPFTCIAELDFNDAIQNYKGKKARVIPKAEKVRSDRIFTFKFPKTFFNDSRFDRTSKFIYAVAAVDAHGLTSGYSAQTEVGFNKNKNSLTLDTISRPGAPKQYPNFFIDPSLDDNFAVDSLTTDAMMSSKKQEITLYFDPDALNVRIDGNENSNYHKSIKNIKLIKSANKDNGAKYVMNILNVDRQVAKNLTIETKNYRSDL